MTVYIWLGAAAALFMGAVWMLVRTAGNYKESKAIVCGLMCVASYALYWVFVKIDLDGAGVFVMKFRQATVIVSVLLLIYMGILNSVMKNNQGRTEKKKEMR